MTHLSPENEHKFATWAKAHNVPFDPSPKADYDMRGYFQALLDHNPLARTAQNANDGKMHFPDYWKTPYHKSFSNESKFADPKTAPAWNNKDQLVDPHSGEVVFDERKAYAGRMAKKPEPKAPAAPAVTGASFRSSEAY